VEVIVVVTLAGVTAERPTGPVRPSLAAFIRRRHDAVSVFSATADDRRRPGRAGRGWTRRRSPPATSELCQETCSRMSAGRRRRRACTAAAPTATVIRTFNANRQKHRPTVTAAIDGASYGLNACSQRMY